MTTQDAATQNATGANALLEPMHKQVNEDVKPFRAMDHAIDPAFLNRWSPRAFSPEPIDDETLMSTLEAARWAASSYNEQPWRFLIARNEEDRKKFLAFLAPPNQAWAASAPVLLLVVSKKTFSHNGTPNSVYQYDAGTCSGYIALQATLNGLIVHGMAGFDRDMARASLGIPSDFDPLAVYAIGRHGDKSLLPAQAQEMEAPSGRRPLAETVMEGGFSASDESAAEADTVNIPAVNK